LAGAPQAPRFTVPLAALARWAWIVPDTRCPRAKGDFTRVIPPPMLSLGAPETVRVARIAPAGDSSRYVADHGTFERLTTENERVTGRPGGWAVVGQPVMVTPAEE
jgi:hypothetical protein